MLRFVLGKPGDGKSLFGMSVAENALVYTEKTVVTNRSDLLPDELNAYLQRKYGTRAPVLNERLRIIDPSETREFYRFRGHGVTLPRVKWHDVSARDMKESDLIAFTRDMADYYKPVFAGYDRAAASDHWIDPKREPGVVYLLDEVHDHFPARMWDKMALMVTYYVTKHRHLNDDIYLTSQAPEQVEVTFKRLVNEWWSLRNQNRMTFLLWQYPPGFVAKGYYEEPSSRKVQEFEKRRFQLDTKGLASCYRTTGALGGVNLKPESQPKKKLPFWTIWVAALLIFVVVFALIRQIPNVTARVIGGVVKGADDGIKKAMGAPLGPKADGAKTSAGANAPSGSAVAVGGLQSAAPTQSGKVALSYASTANVPAFEVVAEPHLDAVLFEGRRLTAILDDGEKVEDRDIRSWSRGVLTLWDGRAYRFRTRGEAEVRALGKLSNDAKMNSAASAYYGPLAASAPLQAVAVPAEWRTSVKTEALGQGVSAEGAEPVAIDSPTSVGAAQVQSLASVKPSSQNGRSKTSGVRN